MTAPNLPPLPEPHSTVDVWGHDVNLYTADQLRAAVLQEREEWKAIMRRAIATCFDERAHHAVLSDPTHFAAAAIREGS